MAAARGSLAAERADLQAAEASPEALAAGKAILEQLMTHLGFDVQVEVATGETSRLNVVGEGDEREALGALIGRKGERLSALQHLVNLMLSKEMGAWTRVLVDVEDYRGRRERQLRDLALRAADRVVETGKMLQLEPMPALERRWIHLTLRDHPDVSPRSRSARSRTGGSSSCRGSPAKPGAASRRRASGRGSAGALAQPLGDRLGLGASGPRTVAASSATIWTASSRSPWTGWTRLLMRRRKRRFVIVVRPDDQIHRGMSGVGPLDDERRGLLVAPRDDHQARRLDPARSRISAFEASP